MNLLPDGPVYIAGHRGLVGGALVRQAEATNRPWQGHSSRDLDLRNRAQVLKTLQEEQPASLVLAAAKVGGIHANNTWPADFLSDNLQIQTSVMDAAVQAKVNRLLFLGSSCIYPKFADQPIRVDSLLTGALEPTNDAYAIAKIAGILQVQIIRRQHGLPYISAMPTNLYGPGDNFDLERSHVMPAMIRKMHEAKLTNAPTVTLWGSGTPRREFLHVDDLASACFFLLEHYDDPQTINVGVGEDLSIRELAELVQATVGYEGELIWDASKPDGTPRKLLDVTRLRDLGWSPQITLADGLRNTYAWFLEHVGVDARL